MNFDTLQKCVLREFSKLNDILSDEYEVPIVQAPTPLEIQMAEQLKEQARQMEEMKRMLTSFLEAEEKAKKEEEEKATAIAKKEEEEKAASIAKKEAEEKEVLRKAEHQRKNTEIKKTMRATTHQELYDNGFVRTVGVYGFVKGVETSTDVIKRIGQEQHMWSIYNGYIHFYNGKLVSYTGDIGYNPQNPNRMIPMFTLIYGEEPALYK